MYKIIILILLSLFVCQGIAWAEQKTATHYLSTDIYEDRRTIPNGGDFTLMTSDGPRSLKQFKDKVVILMFGYLSCPDICPTSVKKVAEALERIDPQERKDVQVLFITLDPERDSLDNLDKFVEYFDKTIIALSGKPEEIKHVADLYGVKFSKTSHQKGSGYFINHSVASYILSPDNVIRYILSHDTTAADMVQVIHNLFKKFYSPEL